MRIGVRFGKDLDMILLDGGKSVDGYEEFLICRKDGQLEIKSKDVQPSWRLEQVEELIRRSGLEVEEIE